MDGQSIIAIAIVVLAAIWGVWMLLAPFIAAMKPVKKAGCGGGCGCGHAEPATHPDKE